MTNQEEFEALKARVRKGNDKLYVAWCQIREIAHDSEEWSKQMDRFDKARELLWLLVKELRARFNFHDCLYLEDGKKMRNCLSNEDGFWCNVCCCEHDNPYWSAEIFDLPSSEVKPTHAKQGATQETFLRKLGEEV